MTRKRNDNHSTEFGLWLREQAEIDSKIGYTATNVDFLWRNYKTKEWIFLEEKRYNSTIKWPQWFTFKVLDEAVKSDKNYRGFYVLTFEKSSPEDGRMKIKQIKLRNSDPKEDWKAFESASEREINKSDLLYFLKNMRLP